MLLPFWRLASRATAPSRIQPLKPEKHAVWARPRGNWMRHAAILDVLRAIKDLAGTHPEVAAWWYAPARRLRLSGERARGPEQALELEVVVEPAAAAAVDCNYLAAELGRKLPGDSVAVRLHRGAAEKRRLFRLKSREPAFAANSWQASS